MGVSAAIFEFTTTSTDENKSGWYEDSINWFDDDQALVLLLNQRKKDSMDFQYREGVAVFCRQELDRIILRRQLMDKLRYERDEIEGNSYHGNLLLTTKMSKPDKKMIIAWIASCLEEIIKRDDTS
jgi:hypothetical protein